MRLVPGLHADLLVCEQSVHFLFSFSISEVLDVCHVFRDDFKHLLAHAGRATDVNSAIRLVKYSLDHVLLVFEDVLHVHLLFWLNKGQELHLLEKMLRTRRSRCRKSSGP